MLVHGTGDRLDRQLLVRIGGWGILSGSRVIFVDLLQQLGRDESFDRRLGHPGHRPNF